MQIKNFYTEKEKGDGCYLSSKKNGDVQPENFMNIKVDTHTHTLVSGHAYSTIREMAEMAKGNGMEAIAFTEHAPEMPGTCGLFYFENLKIVPRERYGIQMLFGTELNILDSEGTVDMRDGLIKRLDIVIASIHPPCFQGQRTKEEVTRAYVNAMKNPYINIIGHPDDGRFPADYEVLARTAKETGTLLEVNHSSMRTENRRENADENIRIMLEYCKKYQTPITTGSDAHIDLDAGKMKLVEDILRECDFPEELVVTTSLEKLKPYVNRFKKW